MFFILRKIYKVRCLWERTSFLEGKNPIDSRDESKKMKTGNQPSSASSNYKSNISKSLTFHSKYLMSLHISYKLNKFIPLNLKKIPIDSQARIKPDIRLII